MKGPETRYSFRGGGINIGDSGMSVGAPQNAGVQHTGAVDVVRIFSPAGGFFRPIQALDARADNSAILWPRHS
jgi:hypothetical protein